MQAQKIEFKTHSHEKAFGEADLRTKAAKAIREERLRVAEDLQFERGYN
jgi:hypothetical protein